MKSPITDEMKRRARQLARQDYHIVVEHTALDSSERVYTLSYLEMPDCLGQGTTLEEAFNDLKGAAYEYILSALSYNQFVPRPYAVTSDTIADGGVIMPVSGSIQPEPQNVSDKPAMIFKSIYGSDLIG